jgi:hypothetical protein
MAAHVNAHHFGATAGKKLRLHSDPAAKVKDNIARAEVHTFRQAVELVYFEWIL